MAPVNASRHHDAHSAAGPAFAQVRESAQAMVAEGRNDEAFDYLLAALAAVLKKSRELELLLAKLRRERLGRTSERVDPEQLALLFQELLDQLGSQTEAPDLEEEAREDTELDEEIEREQQTRAEPGTKTPGRERGWRTRNIKREVHKVEVAPQERVCNRCGKERHKIGEDTTRVLEYVPGHFVEHEYHLEKYACGSCKRGVTTAPAPEKVIARSAADASLLADVVVSKYADHTPLHRLQRIYERSGATIPVSTLSDWIGEVGQRLAPLVDRVAARILHEAHVASTDASGIKVLDRASADNIERGTMWVIVGDGRDVVFRYTPTGEGASGPWRFLAGREGYIQADAHNVFDRLFNGAAAAAVEVGCWAHARRKFVALQDSDCRVAYPIRLIQRLYRLETLATAKKLSPEERAAFRQERSKPVLDKLRNWTVLMLANEPPSSDFAKACAYAINQWTPLTRFLEDGRLSLDNNLCERQIRDLALGRKNFLFAGSHDAARHAAHIYSILRTCALNGVPLHDYLTDVLPRLNGSLDDVQLDALLPDRWQKDRAPP